MKLSRLKHQPAQHKRIPSAQNVKQEKLLDEVGVQKRHAIHVLTKPTRMTGK
jgi:hypothetical protein